MAATTMLNLERPRAAVAARDSILAWITVVQEKEFQPNGAREPGRDRHERDEFRNRSYTRSLAFLLASPRLRLNNDSGLHHLASQQASQLARSLLVKRPFPRGIFAPSRPVRNALSCAVGIRSFSTVHTGPNEVLFDCR